MTPYLKEQPALQGTVALQERTEACYNPAIHLASGGRSTQA
jgi:hypothetical protein